MLGNAGGAASRPLPKQGNFAGAASAAGSLLSNRTSTVNTKLASEAATAAQTKDVKQSQIAAKRFG